jgi:pimeloyl-ACP methyl ester carboxylesterase
MKKGGRNYMKHIIRDKTAYAYKEVGSGPPPLVFVHGWACDHSFFSPQIDYFSRYHRVIAPDLPGHGASDACPLQKYTVTQFADDLAWLCRELQVEQAVLVGHSMGGVVALEAAGKYLQLAAAVCLIDSVVFPPDAFLAELRRLGEQLATTNYTEVLQRAAASLFIEKDDPERKIRLLAKMAKPPQHVAVPAFRSHLLDYDFARGAGVPSSNRLHCRNQPYGRSRSVQTLLPTTRDGPGHGIRPFFSTGSARTDKRDAATLCDRIVA